MTTPHTRVQALLDERGIEYETIHHARDYTAQETAAHTHTRGREFAKAVIVKVGDGYAMAVLPSHHAVDPERLSRALGGERVELASEQEIARLLPDCEVGAIPPFGNLYDLPVYVSPTLTEDRTITCVAGTHEDAMRLAYRDWESITKPRVVDFSAALHGRRGAEAPRGG